MTEQEALALPIENVSERVFSSGTIQIFFNIGKRRFLMKVLYLPSDFYIVSSVRHYEMYTACPFCDQNYNLPCSALDEHRHALFQHLIQLNTLRLPWLYRTYKEA